MKLTPALLLSGIFFGSVAQLIRRQSVKSKKILAGQVAIITGGSRGLGLAIAHEFAKAGVKLVLAARNAEELARAKESLVSAGSVADRSDIMLFACDLTDASSASELVKAAISRFGQLHILVNNAGIIQVGPALAHPIEAYHEAMALNFFAALHLTYAALPHFMQRDGGKIVNISSIGGKFAVPHLLPYVASKFALTGFSEGLNSELRSKNIQVTTVCPGLMRTGGENHVSFRGQSKKEAAWFKLSARTPLIAVSPAYAARQILQAVNEGRAEITISPQAWLAARFAGLAPETTQELCGLVNSWILPSPEASPRRQSEILSV